MAQSAQQQAEQAASVLGCDPQELISPFDLSSITTSKAFPPQKIVVYGVPGIGKTTFAATFPNPILLRAEDGASALDVPTFPKIVGNVRELYTAIKALCGKHDFKTLVIDSLDWLEPLVWSHVSFMEGKKNIEDFGYGKGYVKADEIWREIHRGLEHLRKQGMHIVTIAHAVPIIYDAPDSDSYQRYSIKLHKRGAALWMEWADMLLFINYKTHVVSEDGKKAKAQGSGDRVIYTAERPAYQAKSRWPLDETIYIGNDATWTPFHEQLTEATGGAYYA